MLHHLCYLYHTQPQIQFNIESEIESWVLLLLRLGAVKCCTTFLDTGLKERLQLRVVVVQLHTL